jgi:hypothetical protein
MKIHETTKYEMFRVHPVNRSVKKTSALELSMRRHGFIAAYPIHVIQTTDGKLEIKAGHHRFEVASKLGIPVKYVVCTDNASIHELEKSTNPWSMHDYLDSFCRDKNPHYQELKDLVEETGLRVSQGASLLRGELASSGNGRDQFKAGAFMVKTRELADRVRKIVAVAKRCKVDCATHQHFINALSKMLFVEEFSDDVFIQKIKSHSHMITRKATLAESEQMIEDLYNRQNRSRVNLAFLARTASAHRQARFGKTEQILRGQGLIQINRAASA